MASFFVLRNSSSSVTDFTAFTDERMLPTLEYLKVGESVQPHLELVLAPLCETEMCEDLRIRVSHKLLPYLSSLTKEVEESPLSTLFSSPMASIRPLTARIAPFGYTP